MEYIDTAVDNNSDDVVCLRIGPPDLNPHLGAPRILAIDNVRR